jgi:virginiamycin B lyase
VTRKVGIAIALVLTAVAETPRPGVKTPGVKIPIAKLKPDAVFEVPGAPDWIAVDESVWISNFPKGSVTRIDPKTNKVLAEIKVGSKPCSGLAVGFGSLWVPNCGDKTLTRVDLKTGEIKATIPTTIGDSEGGIVTGAASVWLMTDTKGALARFDPDTNKVVAEISLPAGSFGIAFGEGSVWVTSSTHDLVSRVDARTNLVVQSINVGKKPRFLTVGAGAVWVLNQGDGSVSRIDPKTNKVAATIEVGVPGNGGDIDVGEGSVWVTSFEFPISRIDPDTNKVVQQFAGPGGDALRVGLGSVWLSNLKGQTVWRVDPRRIAATYPNE